MFGNYLGIRKGGGPSSAQNAKAGGAKYGRGQQADSATICQKCLQSGHYSFSCTKEAVYKPRPTRTQQLKNPKLKTKLTGATMDQLELPAKSVSDLPFDHALTLIAQNWYSCCNFGSK